MLFSIFLQIDRVYAKFINRFLDPKFMCADLSYFALVSYSYFFLVKMSSPNP